MPSEARSVGPDVSRQGVEGGLLGRLFPTPGRDTSGRYAPPFHCARNIVTATRTSFGPRQQMGAMLDFVEAGKDKVCPEDGNRGRSNLAQKEVSSYAQELANNILGL